MHARLLLVPMALLLLPACESGVPGGAGAGPHDAGAAVSDAADEARPRVDAASDAMELDASSGGCSSSSLTETGTKMDVAPLTATSGADLDLGGAGGDGITLPEAQAVLCEGTDLGDVHKDGMHVQAWGSSNEVQLEYDVISGDGQALSLLPGYLGTFTFTSDPGYPPMHSFTVGLGPLEEDGAPIVLDWSGTDATTQNDLFNALMYTYGTPLGIYDGSPLPQSCELLSQCPVNKSGGLVQWDIVPLQITFTFGSISDQPAASTVSEIDLAVP
jgi:hypothetical protein